MTVDIIIPCYYSSEIIQPCLEKIMNQTVIKNIIVTIVNDCSPNTECEYQDIIQQYSSQMNIKYLKTEKNSGPGVARQLGLDNATCDWVMFIDDDDELYDETSIERLLNSVSYPIETIAGIGGQSIHCYFGDDVRAETFAPSTHHQGTLFNRKVLQERNIHYEPELSFKEEDGTFSSLFLVKTQDLKFLALDEPVYLKKWTDDHMSLCNQVEPITSMLALIGTKAISLSYINKDNLYFDTFISEAIIIIPNVTEQLIAYLLANDKKLTKIQFEQLKKYVEIYISTLAIFRINVRTFDISHMISNISIFSLNSFYGEFMIDSVYNFEKNYKSYLKIINENCME